MKLTHLQMTRYLFLFIVAVLTVFGGGTLLRIGTNPDRTFLFDQFGWIDFLFVALNVFTLLTLLMARTEFLPV
jgi:hypothetical protein